VNTRDRVVLTTLAFMGLGLLAQPVLAQERGNPDWYVRVAPYLWLSNLGGVVDLEKPPQSTIVGGYELSVDSEDLRSTWALRAEIGKGRWRAWLNASSAPIALSTEMVPVATPETTVEGRYDLKWQSYELFAVRQVGPFSAKHAIEVYAGARLVRQKWIIAPQQLPEERVDESWAEPAIGGRLFTELGSRFWASFNADIGGFGVGSDSTWEMGGEVGFTLAQPLDVTMRYNYLDVEYDNEKSGPGSLRWDRGMSQGWYFGLVLKL
jgi:hypothetical protein